MKKTFRVYVKTVGENPCAGNLAANVCRDQSGKRYKVKRGKIFPSQLYTTIPEEGVEKKVYLGYIKNYYSGGEKSVIATEFIAAECVKVILECKPKGSYFEFD